jgi:hypothetical protein
MIPRSIKQNLAALRRRERLLLLLWGAARWLAVVLLLLLACGLIDWLIDRDRDTPWSIRYTLFGVQAAVATIAAFVFVLWPQLRWLRDDDLALFVEDKLPDLRHRLISAVQLNRHGADLQGMSVELIAVVTREAERQSQQVRFARLADHRRLAWGAALVLPALLLVVLPFLLWHDIAHALLERQALRDVEVPRSIYLNDKTAEIWPSGDKVTLRYQVTGPDLGDQLAGTVTVTPHGQPSDRFPLAYVKAAPSGGAFYEAEVPPSTLDFLYSARLGDGRTRQPGQVKFVPRPVVTEQRAWVLLPAFCGLRPDGSRYEQPQGRGDVVGIPGSTARLVIAVQKPVKSARLEILSTETAGSKASELPGPETCKRTIDMTLGTDGQEAEAIFDLRPEESGYRIHVADSYGFLNVPAPRRGLRVVPEDAPQVFLLRDSFGQGADSDLEGIPVPVGGAIRIPYVAHGPYGLGGARVLYRLLEEHKSGDEEAKLKPWVALPLQELKAHKDSGPFDPKRGVFENSSFEQEVPFHAVPSDAPERIMGRTLGGGRVFLQTKGLVERDEKGNTTPVSLKVGAKIEYCVEVFADMKDYAAQLDPNREYASRRPWARSETRVTEVVTFDQFRAWSQSLADEENRLRKLDSQQRGVFGGTAPQE